MWASLASWIVHDGQFDDLAVGSVVSAGLVLSGRLVTSAARAKASRECAIEPSDTDSLSSARTFRITGMATQGDTVRSGHPRQRDDVAAEFVLVVDDIRFMVLVLGAEAEAVPAGSLVTVEGEVSVLADYQFDLTSLDLDGVARPWAVRAIAVQQYEITWEDEPDGIRSGKPGRLLERTPIERAIAWQDERRFMSDMWSDGPPGQHRGF